MGQNIIYYAHQSNSPMLFFVDTEKSFDHVEWGFIRWLKWLQEGGVEI